MSLAKIMQKYGLSEFVPDLPDVDRPTELTSRLDVLERELGLTDADEDPEADPDAEQEVDDES